MKITLDRAGYYRLEVYTRDRSGNKYWLLLTSGTGKDLHYPSRELEVRWDRERYRVGEEARVLIVPPGEGTFTFLFYRGL